jgi:hypothetical protein
VEWVETEGMRFGEDRDITPPLRIVQLEHLDTYVEVGSYYMEIEELLDLARSCHFAKSRLLFVQQRSNGTRISGAKERERSSLRSGPDHRGRVLAARRGPEREGVVALS